MKPPLGFIVYKNFEHFLPQRIADNCSIEIFIQLSIFLVF